jgi:hypothetical protein
MAPAGFPTLQCRSCTGSMPLRGVLRRSRLPERIRHAGDLWRPNACLMTVWRQGEPASSCKRRAKDVLAIVLARDRSLGANVNVRALQAAQPWAHNSAADEPASRHTFGQRINTPMQNSSLAPRRRTRHLPINIHGRPLAEGRLGRWGGREAGADGSLGRKGAWGGREPGADGSLGRTGVWGGTEYGAERSMGRNGVWGGTEYGRKRSMGRKGVWGARHTPTHRPPL